MAALVAGPVLAQPRFEFERTPTLLPKTVLPSRVQLRLDLDPAQPTFGGDLTISLRVRDPLRAIVLHACDLQADDVTLAQGKGPARSLTITAADKTWQWRLSPVDEPVFRTRFELEARPSITYTKGGAVLTMLEQSLNMPSIHGVVVGSISGQYRLASPTRIASGTLGCAAMVGR